MKQSFFGTDGIRARVGTRPLTHQTLPTIGHALAMWAQRKYGPCPTILLAHDTRESCAYIKAQLKAGMLAHKVTIYDAQVLPTPAVYQLVYRSTRFSCGIIISASHNQYVDNGIKIVDSIHAKITNEDEDSIAGLIGESFEPSYHTFGTDMGYALAANEYCHTMLNFFQSNFLQGIRVVLDCAHGATSSLAPIIFAELGADVVTINCNPNGTNINHECGALHPASLQKAVLAEQADIGFGFDGDGDRLIAITRDGHIKNGDALLALLSEHPRYQYEKTVVGTAMANQGLELFLRSRNKQFIRTPVGDKFVVQYLQHHNLLLGGEQSGHLLLADYLPSSDGIFAALCIAQVMIYTDNNDLETFTPLPQILHNIPVKHKKDLTAEPLASILMAMQAELPDGRLVVRYSGTENVLRVLIEDVNQEKALTLSQRLARTLETLLS
jgi:phosphoglucosamine mutase